MPAIVPVGTAIAVPERHQPPGRDRPHLRPPRASALARARAGAGDDHALSEPRSDRPLFSALRGAAGVRRRHRRRAAAARPGAREPLRGSSTKRSAARSPRSARTICCWSCPATGWSRSASASGCSSGCIGDPEVSGTHEAAPDGFPDGLRRVGRARRVSCGGPRSSTSCRRSSTSSALPIGRDMDGYARTDLFQPRSPTNGRSRSFRPTNAEKFRYTVDRLFNALQREREEVVNAAPTSVVPTPQILKSLDPQISHGLPCRS